MKSRRIAIVAFLLCACMIVGIGYAALTRELSVSGTLHAGARTNLQVWFIGAEIDSTVENNQCSIATLLDDVGNDEALTVSMATNNMQNVGDKAVAKFKIQNKETVLNAVHAELVNPSFQIRGANDAFTNPGDYYTVTFEFVEGDANDDLSDDDHEITIAADGQSVTDLPPQYSVYLVVTVELIKSVIDSTVSHAANFTITYTANAIEH
ncbi:MAG: hypothetical protein E7585_04965 [Ruminococcaceae bacterium]|nr:hypothetical protein [Oscillospiraceae bacterium]